MARSFTPRVSIAEGAMEVITGGWSVSTTKPLVAGMVPTAPEGSRTVSEYGPPGTIPFGQAGSWVGVAARPEQSGTTAVTTPGETKAMRRSGTAAVVPGAVFSG